MATTISRPPRRAAISAGTGMTNLDHSAGIDAASPSPTSANAPNSAPGNGPTTASTSATPMLGAGGFGASASAAPVNIVADFLKSPEDLAKIPALRKKLLKEQASLSAKLKTGAKEQLEATRDGLLKLQATRKDVSAVRDAFSEIEALCGEGGASAGMSATATPTKEHSAALTNGSRAAAAAGKSFRVISEVSQIHRNFAQASTTLDRLVRLPNQIAALAMQLDEAQADLFNPSPPLLSLHYHISELEIFRNESIQISRLCSSEVREALAEYFAPLDGLIKGFDSYFSELCERLMDLMREGLVTVVIFVLKIVEKESREDEKAAAIRLAKKANLEGAARFRSVVANARVIKLYRPKLMTRLDVANKELFDECWARFGAPQHEGERPDHQNFFDHLDWVYKDLEFVREEMGKVFPPDYSIYRFYVKSYNKYLGEILQKNILDTDPEASLLLTLYQFSQEYRKTLVDEHAVEEQWLEPSLLAGREQSIINDYLGLITRKIDEWIANLMSDEVREFVARSKAPDENADGLYGLQYAAIVFQMVNQQVDVAADSNQGNILARAVSHACKAMRQSQATWLRVLEQEVKKQREAKGPEEVVEGLVEYVIALANDQLKSADFGETLMARVDAMVSKKYKAQIREDIDNVVNGYLDVSKRCTQVLVDLVFADLRPALKDLFAFPQWYNEGITTTIVETIRDYTSDYSERLNPNLFDILCDDIMDRLLTAYIAALRRSSKLRMPAAGERMRNDIAECKVMFTAFKSPEDVNTKFEVLDQILGIVTSSATMVFLSYWNFAKAHGSQLAFIESLMRARDDLDKSDVNAIMESARRKVKQENLSDIPPDGITIVGRVEAAHEAGTGFFGGRLNLGTGTIRVPGSGTREGGAGAAVAGAGAMGWQAFAASARYVGAGWRQAANGGGGGNIPPVRRRDDDDSD